MNTITKLLAATALTLGFTASLASCHDNDDITSDNNGNSEQLVSNELTADALHHILYNTTALDTLPSNWTSSSFVLEPTCGEAYDQSNPRVRTIIAESTADAIEFYRLLTAQDGDTYATSWSHDSIGTITLNTDSTASLYGSISLNVRQLNLDQIRFIPASALGSNLTFKKWTPRYHFGDVLEVTKINPTGFDQPEYWLCVRGEFSDENISANKELAHWVCFTLDDENVEHKTGDIIIDAPKNLNGQNDCLQHLPQLLYLILNPERAYEFWNSYVNDKGNPKYGGKSFLGSPFPVNYLDKNDFVRISNNIRNYFAANGGLQTLIPSLDATKQNLISTGTPIAFINEGVSYPSGWRKFNPVTFKNIRKYSGTFYTDYNKYNVKYDFGQNFANFNIRYVVNTPNYLSSLFPELNKSILAATDANDAVQLVVRCKSADKFDGIKNPKNHGEEYVSTKLKFRQIVADPYEDKNLGHAASVNQVPTSDPYLLGELANSKTYTIGKNALCVGYTSDNELAGNEVFLLDGNIISDYKLTPNKEQATRILLNVLNAYQATCDFTITDIFANHDKNLDWNVYNSALEAMRTNSQKLADRQAGTQYACLLDEYFQTQHLPDGCMAAMNYTENGKQKCLEISYSKTDKNYTLTTTDAPINLDHKYTLLQFPTTDNLRDNFQRTSSVGATSRRNALKTICGKIYSIGANYIGVPKE